MEDFQGWGITGFITGFIISIVLVAVITNHFESKVKTSGSYLMYENILYQKVNDEDLDNIVVLEMREE